jgi:hypothetical protein
MFKLAGIITVNLAREDATVTGVMAVTGVLPCVAKSLREGLIQKPGGLRIYRENDS